ncbi:MAG: hypothetical protein V1723_00380 [Candidatus Uhrbacteria bacterium]
MRCFVLIIMLAVVGFAIGVTTQAQSAHAESSWTEASPGEVPGAEPVSCMTKRECRSVLEVERCPGGSCSGCGMRANSDCCTTVADCYWPCRPRPCPCPGHCNH